MAVLSPTSTVRSISVHSQEVIDKQNLLVGQVPMPSDSSQDIERLTGILATSLFALMRVADSGCSATQMVDTAKTSHSL